jgi:hypothetical protein
MGNTRSHWVVVVVLLAVRAHAVVVLLAGGLVARRLPWQIHPCHHAQLLQRVELAVDGGEVQRGDLLLRQLAQLGGGQGTGAALQGLQERVALAGLAFTGFHAHMLMQKHLQQHRNVKNPATDEPARGFWGGNPCWLC